HILGVQELGPLVHDPHGVGPTFLIQFLQSALVIFHVVLLGWIWRHRASRGVPPVPAVGAEFPVETRVGGHGDWLARNDSTALMFSAVTSNSRRAFLATLMRLRVFDSSINARASLMFSSVAGSIPLPPKGFPTLRPFL